ncbi:hypothetical protein NL676_004476 [Syzygium grande]|nr:hypothetical protein NL676_004476 [Syzygium grande]
MSLLRFGATPCEELGTPKESRNLPVGWRMEVGVHMLCQGGKESELQKLQRQHGEKMVRIQELKREIEAVKLRLEQRKSEVPNEKVEALKALSDDSLIITPFSLADPPPSRPFPLAIGSPPPPPHAATTLSDGPDRDAASPAVADSPAEPRRPPEDP